MVNRNASYVRKGFNYQDMAALYYFLSNIDDIKEINNEGKDDVEVILNDNSKRYFQVKETVNVDKALQRSELKDALVTLFEDLLDNKKDKVNEIGVITNNNYPFTKRDNHFIQPQMYKKYKGLSDVAKKRINKLLEELGNSNKKYALDNFDLNKLTIRKIAYLGDDESSRLQELRHVIEKFMTKSRIDYNKYYQLLSDWSFVFYHNSEESDTHITKKRFVRRTEIVIMDDPDLDIFFRKFNIKVGNKKYIRNNYSKYLRMLENDFVIMSLIQKDFKKYSMLHPDMLEEDIEKNFVIEENKVIAKKMALTSKNEDLDIAKLIVWLRVINDSYIQDIEEAIGFEN